MELPELYIQKRGQPEVAVSDVSGLHFTGLTLQSPQPIENTLSAVAGVDGQLMQGPISFGPRTATIGFYFETNGEYDFQLACHEAWKMLFSRSLIRFRDNREPGLVMYGAVKPFDISRISYYDMTYSPEFELLFPFRQTIQPSDKLTSPEIGLNLLVDEMPPYHFTTTDFEVFNPSDIDIQPWEQCHALTITLKGSGTPKIENETTGENFELRRSISDGDVLCINGVSPILNGTTIDKDTNHGTLILVQGKNHIVVTGCSNIDITFSFPFLYF
ncbi:phage tail domain-containing protein [Furfurilactobacillus entadae]|uniref:phage tail domain-containing protein n=1 Tax=Furfurilactobacillus entadae TaxID=2922307 RepID=UPI0035F00785